jgi:hypothetical protein
VTLTSASVASAEAATVAEAPTAPSETPTVAATGFEAVGAATALHASRASAFGCCRSGLEEAGLSRLLGVSVELVTRLEGLCLDALVGFNGKTRLAHGSKDVVHLTNLVFVLQVDASHEKGNVATDNVANEHALTSVRELCNYVHILRGSLFET